MSAGTHAGHGVSDPPSAMLVVMLSCHQIAALMRPLSLELICKHYISIQPSPA